jgi:hypothetical protein
MICEIYGISKERGFFLTNRVPPASASICFNQIYTYVYIYNLASMESIATNYIETLETEETIGHSEVCRHE